MAKNALSTKRVEGIGEGSLAATFARLLQLISEAVVAFDGAGKVLLVNDQATSLLPHGESESLVGADVRALFPPAGSFDPEAPFSTDALPFPVEGTPAVVTMASLVGEPMRLRVRCDRVQAAGETYVLVALPAESESLEAHQGERDFEDLLRANKRLAGALRIVLDTLDSRDVETLFSRVLEEITQTMDADATIVYLAESDGFHLRGFSKSLEGARVPHFMAYGKSVETLATRAGHALRLRVKPPQPQELRQGKIRVSEVVDEETREILRIRKSLLPPFASFFAVPVWFGGHVIAIIEVGWSRPRPLGADDARLLDSVAHYLSVQLMGAFSTMRQQRAERLAQRGSELREELLDASEADEDLASRTEQSFVQAAEELDAVYVRLEENVHQSVLVAELPIAGMRAVPIDLDAVEKGHVEDNVAVVPVQAGTRVFDVLRDLGEPCVGALVDAGKLAGERRCCLVLRPDGAEPLDSGELSFLGTLAGDVRDIFLGEERREKDKRISQALQTGMRNVLQRVDGLTAQGIYSSATESAFVGGDFYDLIRLPGRRACVTRLPWVRTPGRDLHRRAWCARSTSSFSASRASRRSRRSLWASWTLRRRSSRTAQRGIRLRCSCGRQRARLTFSTCSPASWGPFTTWSTATAWRRSARATSSSSTPTAPPRRARPLARSLARTGSATWFPPRPRGASRGFSTAASRALTTLPDATSTTTSRWSSCASTSWGRASGVWVTAVSSAYFSAYSRVVVGSIPVWRECRT